MIMALKVRLDRSLGNYSERAEQETPMRRNIIVIFILLGLGYWAYSSWQERVETERAQLEEDTRNDARCEVLKKAVAEMAAKSNAITNWPESLAGGEKRRRTPVMSAELQKTWVNKRPVLFIGNIKDIAINKDGTYQIIVDHNCFGNHPRFLFNDIRVSLRCQKSCIAPLIQSARSEQRKRRDANVAVTGLIERIAATTEKNLDASDDEIETINVLTGVGKCVNALYLAERISW